MQQISKAIEICQRLKDAGGLPYLVGGYVRDHVIGIESHDIDIVVVGLSANAVETAFAVQSVGKSFPVFMIDGVEVALARKEKKTGVGHVEFECETAGITLQQDLFRRDLTMNAMAMDPFTCEIIDPYGGQEDIKCQILNPVSSYFSDDPLRVLRAARFSAQLEMTISDSLVDYSKVVLSELNSLSGERIWGELEKALRTQKPSRFFEALDKLGALSIVFPEIAALKGRIQPEKYHPEGCVLTHAMLVVDRARELGADDETMFAALVHDLGKAVTPDDDLPRHINHEALGVPLVDAMCDRLKIPNSHKRVGRIVAREHLNIHRFADLKPVTKVRMLTRIGALQDETIVHKLGLAAQADAQGRGPTMIDKPYLQREMMLEATRIIRTVKGDQFSHLSGDKIAAKMEEARTKALKREGF